MTRNALTWTYRIAAGAAIVCAPFGALHAGFAVAGLLLAVPAVLVYTHLHPGLRRGGAFRHLMHHGSPGYRPPYPDTVNPATGLPMNGMVDTGGNPYGAGIRKSRTYHDL